MSDHRDTLPDASLRMSTEIQPAIESQSSAGQYTDYPSTDMSGKRRNPAKKAKVVISDNDTSDESYNSNGTESLLKLLEREDWSGLPELPGGKFLQWYASMPENPAQNKSTDDSQLSDSESSSSSPILLGMAEVITFQRVRSAAPSPSVIYIGRRVVSRGPSSRNASSGGYDSTREGRSGIPSGSISPLDLAVDTIVSHMGPSSFPFPLTELSGPSKSSEDAEEHQDN